MRITAALALMFVFVGWTWSQPADSSLAFDVASVKLAPPPDGRGTIVRASGIPGGPGSKDPGHMTVENYSLPSMILTAYGIPTYRLSAPDLSYSMPMFNVEARMPAGTTKEQFQVMMQNLLKERFALKTHWESGQMGEYELVAAKGGVKLKEAEPDSSDAPPPAPFGRVQLGPNGFPALPQGKYSAMAMMNGKAAMRGHLETADQIAEKISNQMGAPVENGTGLTGKYDYTLFWSSEPMRAAPRDGEEDSGPSLLTAIQEQLGLKLQAKKGPVQVLIVDHIDSKPVEN